jgi:APA family basic amino acid/polyamine antiporter
MDERKLGLWMCVALVVGNTIGSGIFLLPAALAPFGLNSLLAWLATSFGAVMLACVFSGLGNAFPEEEGSYGYVRMAFGDLAAFVVAWGYWIAIWVGNAAIATGSISYLGNLVPALASPTLAAVTTVVVVWLLTAVNLLGVRAAGGLQVVTTVLKLLPLLAIAAMGLVLFFSHDPRLDWQAAKAVPLSAGGVTSAAALTLWALLGFESAAVAAKRVRDPRRTIPLATVIGTLVVSGIYILSCTAVMFLLSPEALAKSGAPFADVAARLWGSEAGHAIAAFAAISGLGALNGWILLSGEVPFRLAQRGVFPKVFARETSRHVPAFALCASSVLVTLLVLLNLGKSTIDVFTFMLLLSTTSTLALYLTCSVGLLVLARRGALGALGAHVRWLVLAGALGALYSLWTLYGAGAEALLWGLVLFAAAVPVFYLMRRQARAGAQA